jgi:hypothetical protein
MTCGQAKAFSVPGNSGHSEIGRGLLFPTRAAGQAHEGIAPLWTVDPFGKLAKELHRQCAALRALINRAARFGLAQPRLPRIIPLLTLGHARSVPKPHR